MAASRSSVAPARAGTPVALWLQVARRVAARPRLWVPAMRQAWRSTPRDWWRHPPFVPRPDRRYLAFRWETQYGTGRAGADRVDDVVAYLEWCAASERMRRRARPGPGARR